MFDQGRLHQKIFCDGEGFIQMGDNPVKCALILKIPPYNRMVEFILW